MTIYLDYLRSQTADDIIFLSLFDENGNQHDFFNNDLNTIDQFLTQEVTIITYERPFMHLVPHVDEDDIEDYEIRMHYKDMFRVLESETGFKISLTGLAKGMMGYGPQSFIPKLETKDITSPGLDVQNKVHERLRAIRDIHQAILVSGFVNFYFKRSLYSEGVDVDGIT